MIGEKIGHYVILRQLGLGGMGEVFLAEDTKLGRNVALKLLPPDVVEADRVERFRREARAVAALSHPVVVSTSWGSSLPPVSVTMKLLRATLSRIFALAASYAGPGGELSLSTLGLVDGAGLSVAAMPVGSVADSQQAEEVLLRCRSLEQFIHELGGRFEVELGEAGALQFRAQLAGAKKLS